MHDLCGVQVSGDGYIYWVRGLVWFSLACWRDNFLLVTNWHQDVTHMLSKKPVTL